MAAPPLSHPSASARTRSLSAPPRGAALMRLSGDVRGDAPVAGAAFVPPIGPDMETPPSGGAGGDIGRAAAHARGDSCSVSLVCTGSPTTAAAEEACWASVAVLLIRPTKLKLASLGPASAAFDGGGGDGQAGPSSPVCVP